MVARPPKNVDARKRPILMLTAKDGELDEAVLDAQGQVDPARLDLVSRMGGAWYGRTQSDANFTLSRPKGWDQRKG